MNDCTKCKNYRFFYAAFDTSPDAALYLNEYCAEGPIIINGKPWTCCPKDNIRVDNCTYIKNK